MVSDALSEMKRFAIRLLLTLGLLNFARRVTIWLKPWILFRNALYKLKGAPDNLPLPPSWLIYLAVGTPDIRWFLRGGVLAVESITSSLKKNGVDIGRFASILDFGCGCGRVIRHLQFLTDARLYGTDYNPELINWCERNLTRPEFKLNALSPPLQFEDEKFDFIYAISVFTHLPESLQLSWIDELWRVLRLGGYLLMTTHGEHYLSRLTPDQQKQFAAGKLVVTYENQAGANICGTFHPPLYVYDKLAKNFTVVDFIPKGFKGAPYQDTYLLRKPKNSPQ